MHIVRFPLIALLLLLLMPGASSAQHADLSFLVTAAERTGFDETTRYDEVMAFLEVAVSQSPSLQMTTFGYSLEGRALPLVIFGNAVSTDPSVILSGDRLRIFIQANIHAGEVCGKEALLMLIREMAEGKHAAWADSAIILMAPIYNADGNERVNLFNRPRQNGPHAGMGQRPNAQGLDLNRDHMKVKSPEARSLIRLMNMYDPHVLVDLHTTNGTRHGYHITYSPPLNPNTDEAIDGLLRETLLPAIRADFSDQTGWEAYYYGNLPFRRGEAGWYTFDHRPRFNNNYIGLRNRVAILSEAYAYATFEERVLATRAFTVSTIREAIGHAAKIKLAIRDAEARSAPGLTQGVRFEPAQSEASVDILMGTTETRVNPYSGAPYFHRTDSTYIQSMPEYGAFAAIEAGVLPAAYVVTAAEAEAVASQLDIHGIRYDRLVENKRARYRIFQISGIEVAAEPFQQIREEDLSGSWEENVEAIEAGALWIPMDQPASRLAYYLLEPRSDDGLANWGFFSGRVAVGGKYPIRRVEPAMD
ncbi:MAG: M14 family metallopeptidase [Bacteroidetes bacterium]|nr:M14 family metallopeptidase [Bacteroidota bacterium]